MILGKDEKYVKRMIEKSKPQDHDALVAMEQAKYLTVYNLMG
jgi:hypothetical protein